MNKKDSRIYLDYAASTPVDEQVVLAMKPYWSENFGNPGSIHKEGVRAKAAIDISRKSIAATLCAKEDEIIFTGNGTEANNLAIYGVANYLVHQKRDLSKMHFITSQIEHPSVLNLFQDLEARGAHVTYIEVTPEGSVRPTDVMDVLKEDTVLVSIMFANNEIGTINQIANIAKLIKAFRKQNTNAAYPYFHTDASQALIFSPINVEKLGVDLLTIDAQKIYGPKGIGALYKKRNTNIVQVIIGGNQEFGLRSGTESVPLIVGFAKALEIVEKNRGREGERLEGLRDHFLNLLKSLRTKIEINGDLENRASNNVNISIPGIESEYAVVLLDNMGIACGSRSSCVSNDSKESYVVEALGKSKEIALSSLRFTFGKDTSKEDIDYTFSCIKKIIANFDKSK